MTGIVSPSKRRAEDDNGASTKKASKESTMSSLDQLAINSIRCMGADMVQKAKSGHPGAPMGCAPMAHALFAYIMKYCSKMPEWWNRDRFVLSNGHGCALLYTMLHLSGYEDVSMEELKNFRQVGALTAGHPESTHLKGVEVTTGPLGQGISNAVGLAIAQSNLAALYNKPGFDLFDNYTYAICGDGCLMEGVSYEASSLAGHMGLGRLIVLYDDNSISIDGSTELAFTEDVTKRFEAQGWQVLRVDDGNSDLSGIMNAVEMAKDCTGKPTLIRVRTAIGYGSSLEGTAKVHGAPLGPDEIKSVKAKFGLNPEEQFIVPENVKELYSEVARNGTKEYYSWVAMKKKYAVEYPVEAAELERRFAGELPDNWTDSLPKYTPQDAAKATRQYSGDILASLVKLLPEMVGGSADLTGSNLTNNAKLEGYKKGQEANRYLHFGVREHGMAAIVNGLSAYGGFIPYCATFLNFVGYCWGSTRLAALSKLRSIFVATHDSIDLGEDGPTHQPVEILPLIRATPNIVALRPCDGEETVGSYICALSKEMKDTPTLMALSRGAAPNLEGSSREAVAKGAYILKDFKHLEGSRRVILSGSGTEVSLVVSAADKLEHEHGFDVRIVSVPCMDLFFMQHSTYRDSVFPKGTRSLYCEASSTFGFDKIADLHVGMEGWGLSGPAKEVKKVLGFSQDNIVATVLEAFKA